MYLLQILIGVTLIQFGHNSVIRSEGAPAESLYNNNDKVVVLTHQNFYKLVYDQPYASNVEFYNSFCGFCRNFAPIYKEFAEDIHRFKNIVQVAAIDCADDANNDVCRDMEIMRYPTLRYFPPFYRNESNNFGIEIQHPHMQVGESFLYDLMANTTTAPSSWPNLHPIETSSKELLFDSLPSNVEYVFIVSIPTNDNVPSIVAQKVALDLNAVKEIQVRQSNSIATARKLGLNVDSAIYVANKKQRTIDMITQSNKLDRLTVRETIQRYLNARGFQINTADDEQLQIPDKDTSSASSRVSFDSDENLNEVDLAIIEHVKANPGVVFQSDLEMALRFAVFHELVKYNNMNEEQLAALKRFVLILQKHSPLGDNGKRFLNDLNGYVSNKSTLTGKQLGDTIKELEAKYHPIFSSSKWIGCKASVKGRRGFSCGLWQLFHYLTVQANNSERSNDPLEVLHAIHDFVKYFFGCTHCSQHFQEMAEKNHMWKVATKDNAVLWLWSAHNEVNHRLAGDDTEDPAFKKIQYPARDVCFKCYQQMIPFDESAAKSNNPNQQISWDTSEVLFYLRLAYSMMNLSRYGVDDDNVLPASINSYPSKLLSNSASSSGAFSDIDIRMGILLYAFCMLIIVVAVKLLLQRGYRKKIYTHDFLGKI